ncbi:cell adhesion molecule-related/down-regulated by oncogenes-like [Argonauta hians]
MPHYPISVQLCLQLVLVFVASIVEAELIQYVQEPVSTVVLPNSPVSLTCPVTPASAQVQWFHEDKPITDLYDGVTVNGTSLFIKEFHSGNGHSSHEGQYYCIATTEAGSLISEPAWLQVPQFQGFSSPADEENITVSVIEGGTVSLPCGTVSSRPKAQLAFEKVDDTGYSNTSYSIVTPSTNLLLNDVQVVDGGVYRCVATNPLTNETSTATNMVTLNVISLESAQNQPPFIFGSKKPTIFNVPEGATIVLECAAYAKPPPKITWRKYGGQLSEDKRQARLSGNYILKNVKHRDKGTYICHADNGIGNKVEKVFQIEVFEPPKLDTGHVIVAEGEKAILSCIINKKSNYSMKWYHNGQIIVKSKNIRIRDTSIVIKSALSSSSGLYQCMVYSAQRALYAVIQLEVTPATEHNNNNNNNNNNKKDKDKKDNTRLPSKDKKRKQNISPSQASNGNKLKVHHKHKNGKWRGRIKANRRKNRNRKKNSRDKSKGDMVVPTKPKVTKQSDTSVLIEWTIPENDGLPIKFFVVQYKEVFPKKDHWQTEDKQILSKSRKVTVNRLKPGATYKFRIVAVYSNNDNAPGDNSDPFTLISDGDHTSVKRLIDGPTIVKVEELVVDRIYAIVVEWKYIPLKSVPISGFIIFYKPYHLDVSFSNITLYEPVLRKHIIKNLKPGTDYRIKMECFNKYGYSKFSNKVVQRTSPAENWHSKSYVPPYIRTAISSRFYPPITQMTTPPNTHRQELNNFQSSGELLYKILGGILSVMVLVLLVLIVMCCLRQRQPPMPRASYYKESMSRMSGSLSNGTHHSHQYCQHTSLQTSPKSYTVTDLIDGYTSAPPSSKSMYSGHLGNHDTMYHHTMGDSNCNNIDQSKSPQIMQVKHSGSNNNHHHISCSKLEKLKSCGGSGGGGGGGSGGGGGGGSVNGLEQHMVPCNKAGSGGGGGVTSGGGGGGGNSGSGGGNNSINNHHKCVSYERIPTNTRCSSNSLYVPQDSNGVMVPDVTHEEEDDSSLPPYNFFMMKNQSSSKPKKKRHRHYEHSTRDQATNTDLSSNEGTLEFSPLKKSPSKYSNREDIISSNYSLTNSTCNHNTPLQQQQHQHHQHQQHQALNTTTTTDSPIFEENVC